MGIVFRAVQEPDGEIVALKILKLQLSRDDVFRHRLAHETRAATEVKHKHLVPILDAGEIDGYSYVVVNYIKGCTLGERIKAEGRLPVDEALRVAADIGGGLDALHSHQLVHRDVKPSNIMLSEEGEALLTDFGLAKGPAYTILTKKGEVMGTLDYLAPELIRGQPASPASDLYALGCVVYECIAGIAPFAMKSVSQVALAHLEEDPPDLSTARPDCPSALSWAVLSALSKDPAQRPSTGTGYANLLRVAARDSHR
jgi:serine/threonine protein kinase